MRISSFKRAIIAGAVLLFPYDIGTGDAEAQNYIINYGKKLANGKTCRVVLGETHYHAANGAHSRKARAKAMAIADWSSFVVFEYGNKWGRWSHADKKSTKCMRDKAAGVWRCRAVGQPCL